ncbi:MAG: hypothetical protein EXS37_01060 [Opitutus sp.]|nr:hypothetical protein [Opitutus sp.]
MLNERSTVKRTEWAGVTLRGSPQQDYFRTKFLADLQNSRPAFFVDAIGPGGFLYQNPATDGPRTFPGLQAFLEHDYRLVAVLDSYPVYLRRDRLPARHD